ncbi:MAG: adenylosuccinate lyase [Thermoflexales bacterium]|nr:adenylosuccinate lyase [Thermoflexales bacterium]
MSEIDQYQSPFTVRYGSAPMRALWSERAKRLTWRHVWVALAEAQAELGLITAEQAADLRAHMHEVSEASVARALEIEREIHHDLMAELRAYAEQCPVGGAVLHLGATSADIEDNADALRLREGIDLLRGALRDLIRAFAEQTLRYADLPTMAFTHLQPAEPTTVGYRLAQYLQDLLLDDEALRAARALIRGKGFRGAVGTSASYAELTDDPAALEQRALAKLGLEAFPVSTQIYPRKQEWTVVNALAGLGQTLYKFAFDLRLLQSPPLGEWSEPFGVKQVGSSAMPFKRNPVLAERIGALARFLAALPRVFWDNAAHSLLERTLDDSANRRAALPEAFLAADEIVQLALRVVRGLQVNEVPTKRTLQAFSPFAATERLLMALVKAGADRQAAHEVIRERAMEAWAAVVAGLPNPLADLLCSDARVTCHLSPEQVRKALDGVGYVGDAPRRARALANFALERLAHDPMEPLVWTI